MRRRRHNRPGRRGFTLIEVLVALAMTMLIVVGLNTFIFSMTELWGKGANERLFDQHVRAVTRFLQAEISEAAYPPSAIAGATPIGVQAITPSNGSADNLITFTLLSGSRIISWPDNRPLPEVVCSLQARDGQGLFLLWHSDLEKNFNTDPPRETLLSPFVTSMAYDYYDADSKRWTTETSLRKDNAGNSTAPQRLRLEFLYDRIKRETLILLPTTPQGMPNPL